MPLLWWLVGSLAGACSIDQVTELTPDASFGGVGATGGIAEASFGGTSGAGGLGGVSGGDGALVDGSDSQPDVPEAGPPKPTDYAGLLLWLRSDLQVVVTGSNVDGWTDQSGNGNDYAAPSPATAPTFTTNALNGKSGVSFAPAPAKPRLLVGSGLTLTTGITVFVVARIAAPPGVASYLELFQNAVAGSNFRIGMTGNPINQGVYLGTGPTVVRAQTPFDTSVHIYEIVWNGADPASPASFSCSVDGKAVAPIAASALGLPKLSAIGASSTASAAEAFNGDVGELVVYDHALSAIDRDSLSTALREYWGLP